MSRSVQYFRKLKTKVEKIHRFHSENMGSNVFANRLDPPVQLLERLTPTPHILNAFRASELGKTSSLRPRQPLDVAELPIIYIRDD